MTYQALKDSFEKERQKTRELEAETQRVVSGIGKAYRKGDSFVEFSVDREMRSAIVRKLVELGYPVWNIDNRNEDIAINFHMAGSK